MLASVSGNFCVSVCFAIYMPVLALREISGSGMDYEGRTAWTSGPAKELMTLQELLVSVL